MDLHRRTRLRSLGLVLAGGAALLWLGLGTGLDSATAFGGLFLLAGLAWGTAKLVRAMVPFRFSIGQSGIDVRHGDLRRLVRWHEIESLQMCPSPAGEPPYLLLVPAATADLGRPLDATSPVDGRAGHYLLNLATVKDSPDRVAQALTRCAGSRFQDRRGLPPGPPFNPAKPGYDLPQVDELVGPALAALASGTPQQRAAARTALTGTELSVRPVGYDREQVDHYVAWLAAQLDGDPDAP